MWMLKIRIQDSGTRQVYIPEERMIVRNPPHIPLGASTLYFRSWRQWLLTCIAHLQTIQPKRDNRWDELHRSTVHSSTITVQHNKNQYGRSTAKTRRAANKQTFQPPCSNQGELDTSKPYRPARIVEKQDRVSRLYTELWAGAAR